MVVYVFIQRKKTVLRGRRRGRERKGVRERRGERRGKLSCVI